MPTSPSAIAILAVGGPNEAARSLAEALRATPYTVVGPDAIPAASAEVISTVQGLAQRGEVRAVLLVGGGPHRALRAATEGLRSARTRAIPGFAELLRVEAFRALGPAAMLIVAEAGFIDDLAYFALPAHGQLCRLAWERLVEPLLMVLRPGEITASEPPVEPSPAGSSSGPRETSSRGSQMAEVLAKGAHEAANRGRLSIDVEETSPDSGGRGDDVDETPAAVGWRAALAALGAQLEPGGWPTLPEELAAIPAACDVLHRAGQRGVVRLDDRTYAAFGFPDLVRVSSKVLLVGPGAPCGEIVALHRHPRRVAVCADGARIAPTPWDDADAHSRERTGRPAPEGQLFAVDGAEIYLLRDGAVWRWDGRQEIRQGTPKQVAASLVLRWSQR